MKEVECIAKLLIIWEQSFENNQEIYLSVWKDGPLTSWECDLDMISLSKTWTTFPPTSFPLQLCIPTDENKSLSSLLGRKRPTVTPGRPKRGQEARAGKYWIEFRKWGISSNSLESFPPRDITLYNSGDVQKQRNHFGSSIQCSRSAAPNLWTTFLLAGKNKKGGGAFQMRPKLWLPLRCPQFW